MKLHQSVLMVISAIKTLAWGTSILSISLIYGCSKKKTNEDSPIKIEKITPDQGYGGTEVVLVGKSFSKNLSDNIVTFDGVSANVKYATTDTLIVFAPPHAPGKVDVKVGVDKYLSNQVSFNYLTQEVAYIPQKGKKYIYSITGDESGQAITQVTGTKDSLGIEVSSIETLIKSADGETVVASKAFANQGITTMVMYLPADFKRTLEEIKQLPGYSESLVTGFPHYQTIETNASINSPMIFRGPDIRIYFKFVFPGPPSVTSTTDVQLTYNTGKMVKAETLKTTAGTFECTKWEFSVVNVTKTSPPNSVRTLTFNHTVWYAKGVGVVKSIEESVNGTSTTTLEKIQSIN